MSKRTENKRKRKLDGGGRGVRRSTQVVRSDEEGISAKSKGMGSLYPLVFWVTLLPWEFIVYYYFPWFVVFGKYKYPLLGLMLVLPFVFRGAKNGAKQVAYAFIYPLIAPYRIVFRRVQFSWSGFLNIILIQYKMVVAIAITRMLRVFYGIRFKIGVLAVVPLLIFLVYDIGHPTAFVIGSITLQLAGASMLVVLFASYVKEIEWIETLLGNLRTKRSNDDTDKSNKQSGMDRALGIILMSLLRHALNAIKVLSYTITIILGRLLMMIIIVVVPSYFAIKMLLHVYPEAYEINNGLQSFDIAIYIVKGVLMQGSAAMVPMKLPATVYDLMYNLYGVLIIIVAVGVLIQESRNSDSKSVRAVVDKLDEEIERQKELIFEDEKRSYTAVLAQMRKDSKYSSFIEAIEEKFGENVIYH